MILVQSRDTFQGFEVTENDLIMISDVVKNTLNISCGALMGANLANEIAMEQFAEATIGILISVKFSFSFGSP